MTWTPPAVVPVLVGPLQALFALLPGLLLALGAALLGMFRPRAIWAGLKLLWRQKIGVAALAGVTIAVVLLAHGMFSSGGPDVAREENTSQSWTMFRGGLSRRGNIDGVPGPTGGGLNWSFLDGGPTYYSTPTVVGNRLYVTSADQGPFKDRGAVYCLDADTGGQVWSSAPDGFRATFSSPAVAGRFLVCGEGLHFTDDARVVCLDVQDGGRILWTYRTASHVESSPCIDEDRVYIGAGDDGYYCFRLEPDDAGNAQMLWHAEGHRYPDAETSPAVCDGKTVVGLGMGGKAVCCLHSDAGDELWRTDTPYPVFGPPTIVDDRVFVGMGNGNFIESAEVVRQIELEKLRQRGASADEIAAAEQRLGPMGQVWCLDLETGNVVWKFSAGRTILGAVAAGDEALYFGSRDGHVYCVSLDGRELARWNAHAPIVASPALTGRHVYVLTESGKLYGLSADDLELAWESTVGFQGPFLSSPTVARGHVYVGSPQDGLLCLGVPVVDEQKPVWAGKLGGPGRGGCIDDQPLPQRGKFAWRFPKSEDASEQPDVAVTAPVACLDDRVYVPMHGDLKGLVCLRDDPGSRDGPVELWRAESRHGVWISPAATTDAVFFTDGKPGNDPRLLRCLDAKTGSLRWQLPVAPEAGGELLLSGEGGLIADRVDGLASFDSAGNVLWRTFVGRVRGTPAVNEAMIVVATDQPPGAAALDRLSGKILWQVSLENAPAAGPVLRKTTVYLGTDTGLAALKLVDGSQVWQQKLGMPSGPLTLRKDQLAYVSSSTELVLVSAETGKVAKRVPGTLPGVPPTCSRDAILFANETGLARYDVASGQAELWTRTSWLGQVASPIVLANSRVYFGTEHRGLVCAEEKRRR